MYEEIIRQVGKAVREIGDINLVLHKESWIITESEGRVPRLEKARYFSFMNRKNMWTDEHRDIIVTTPEAEQIIREYIRDVLGLAAFPPGTADPSSLLEVWT